MTQHTKTTWTCDLCGCKISNRIFIGKTRQTLENPKNPKEAVSIGITFEIIGFTNKEKPIEGYGDLCHRCTMKALNQVKKQIWESFKHA